MRAWILLTVLILSGCASFDRSQESRPNPQGRVVELDQQLVMLGRLVPGFGGMYFDANGNFTVFMVDPNDTSEEALRQVFSAVYGPEVFGQGMKGEQIARPRINIVKADYSILQLADWRTRADHVLNIPGTVLTDLDEGRNRLRIGIESEKFRAPVEAELKNQGIPLDAAIIEIIGPIRFAKDLRDKFRPVQGGVQVEADTGIFAFKLCTMGFNAIHNNQKGFVTNSHCTKKQGGSEGTSFHQPTDPINPFADQKKVGDELFDPGYWTSSICPSGRVCRTSDSAFIEYDKNAFFGSSIAQTDAISSLTIDGTSPSFFVAEETFFPIQGVTLNKVGRTTGWTEGVLSGTCNNINVADSNITLLCQYTVTRVSGTHQMAFFGDSGSPVFQIQNGNSANLFGILWGINDAASLFSFSSMLFVHLDLFPLTVIDFPEPAPVTPRPIGCPVDEKCCEKELNGDCLLCIPRTAACP